MESVTVVTNGSLVKEKWLQQYAKNLDIMAVSCDSFDEKTNMMIGRGKGNHLETFVKLSELCRKYNIMFKVNTVVCRYNINEDMNAMIEKVAPFRWKCFQVLVVEGENDSSTTLRVCRIRLLFLSQANDMVFLCRMLSASLSPTKNTTTSATVTSTSKALSLNPMR